MTYSPGLSSTKVGHFNLSTGDLHQHIAYLNQLIDTEKGCWVVTLNTEMLARAEKNEWYLNLLQQADLFVADGMPLVWASNSLNRDQKIHGRTTGVDLVHEFLNHRFDFPFAVIGGIDPMTTISKYSGALDRCVYCFNGRVVLESPEIDKYIDELQSAGPLVVFIALGVPKQDQLALAIKQRLPNMILIGVGGTFEILSENSNRAPVWMQNAGLEWLFRLSREPGRLWKRYLVHYPTGIWVLLKLLLLKKGTTT